MKTSNNWFDDGPRATWEKHLLPLKDSIDSYLEIGVCEGISMRWILENIEPSKAVGIDPWKAPKFEKQEIFDKYQANAMHNLAPWLVDTVTLVPRTSWFAFTGVDSWKIEDNSFDLAYVDGSHDGSRAMEDMVHVWRKLKRGTEGRRSQLGGGIMIVDDLHRRWHRGRALVRPAVEAFRLAYDGLWTVLWETPRQVAFLKHKD